jgi:hypothetical protein
MVLLHELGNIMEWDWDVCVCALFLFFMRGRYQSMMIFVSFVFKSCRHQILELLGGVEIFIRLVRTNDVTGCQGRDVSFHSFDTRSRDARDELKFYLDISCRQLARLDASMTPLLLMASRSSSTIVNYFCFRLSSRRQPKRNSLHH